VNKRKESDEQLIIQSASPNVWGGFFYEFNTRSRLEKWSWPSGKSPSIDKKPSTQREDPIDSANPIAPVDY
jgi:hypothetical protein